MWQILEPVMNVEVTVPSEFAGAVMASLSRRHALVLSQETAQEYFTCYVEVRRINKAFECIPILSSIIIMFYEKFLK